MLMPVNEMSRVMAEYARLVAESTTWMTMPMSMRECRRRSAASVARSSAWRAARMWANSWALNFMVPASRRRSSPRAIERRRRGSCARGGWVRAPRHRHRSYRPATRGRFSWVSVICGVRRGDGRSLCRLAGGAEELALVQVLIGLAGLEQLLVLPLPDN